MESKNIFQVLQTCFIISLTLGQTLNQSRSLMDDMLANYDRRHRPVLNQSKAVEVEITLDIICIQDFDEVAGLFSIIGVTHVLWYDEQLVWDPCLYGGINYQMFKSENIWYPMLMLTNSFSQLTPINSNNWADIRVMHDGKADMATGDMFRSTCSPDVTYYPFDTQLCLLTFIPWGQQPSEIQLRPGVDHVKSTFYTTNGEWELLDTSTTFAPLGHVADTVEFSIKIRRKPLFLLVNVILPIIFMLAINILVFVLPNESGERVSYSVTVLLALAVFLTLVGDNLPKTSQPMSALCYFLMICLSISALICVCNIFSVRIFYKCDDVPVPPCIVQFTRLLTCRKANSIYKKRKAIKILDEDTIKIDIKDNQNKSVPELIPYAEESKVDAETWKNVSTAVDRVCIIFFLLASVTAVSIYLYILGNNTQNM